MKTIEQKAEEAWMNYEYPAGNLYENVFKDAYLAGAKEALAGQWRSVKDEMPPRKQEVLICTDKGQIKSSCWQGSNPNDKIHRYMYWKWWGNIHPTVLYWMPIPEPPKTEKK